ncbi:Asp-tRNA(Asn)/Glu-tRNA(Gln) amidotransferase subunit GatC [Candidatus Woesebacteria bacterium]|nr:Asp-tRNA(Asn)/Glu-tRNA(Gln) amidotransferase subunit GatC [Candidatus Woesebacteria bacterium]MCD8507583.1 Asp-tRNA(Asn)/Glu-tRNA(Gln) amidotransferase subunit GatC [Candidatus Woesebacteria bacterium]MCD8546170.1 Asp-tRNA(Asn)/Glu-tRNA(Gln) amidotransferase subunit GatC [Candidatus Woesebacteria bacterium]
MKKQSSASEPSAVQVTPATVAHIGQLANLEISNQEQQQFAQAFTETLAEVQKIFAVDVSEVEPTHHVTGLVNVWREDVVDENQVLSQEQALSGAKHTFGKMIVVDRVLEGDTA